MTSRANDSPADAARLIIDANSYATLATADREGIPWATPVWFAQDGLREFIWVSRPERRHSQNLAERADIALVVFDSTVAPGSGSAVYVEAAAVAVPDDELADPLAVFNAKCEARGLRAWHESKVSEDAAFRLYRATASRVWVLDENEQRVPVVP